VVLSPGIRQRESDHSSIHLLVGVLKHRVNFIFHLMDFSVSDRQKNEAYREETFMDITCIVDQSNNNCLFPVEPT
jgi:hypothetical protein